MVGFLTGFAKRTSENLRTLQNKADDTIKSYALQAAQDAKEVRKQRVKGVLDYTNMAEALKQRGLNDAEVQAVLRGGIGAGQQYIDGENVARSEAEAANKTFDRNAFKASIFTAIDGVDTTQQVRNIADQARYYAQSQNPYAGEDIEAFASNIADSTQTLIGGVPMSYIKSGIESNMKAQMGGRMLKNVDFEAQAPRYNVNLPLSLEEQLNILQVKKLRGEVGLVGAQTEQIYSNIKVNDETILQIKAKTKNISEDTKKIIADVINDAAKLEVYKDTFKLDKEKFEAFKSQFTQELALKTKDQTLREKETNAKIQNWKNTYDLQDKTAAMEILYKQEQINQWKNTEKYKSPAELYGYIVKQQSDLRQQISTADKQDIPKLEAELSMLREEEKFVLIDMMEAEQAKDTSGGLDFTYLPTFKAMADDFKDDFGRTQGVKYNPSGKPILIGETPWNEFEQTEEYTEYLKNEAIYVKENGLRILGGKFPNDAAKTAFDPPAKEDNAQVTTKMTVEEHINDIKSSNKTPNAVILDAIQDETWTGSDNNILYVGSIIKKAFPEKYAGQEGNNKIEDLIRTMMEENKVENNEDVFSLRNKSSVPKDTSKLDIVVNKITDPERTTRDGGINTINNLRSTFANMEGEGNYNLLKNKLIENISAYHKISKDEAEEVFNKLGL